MNAVMIVLMVLVSIVALFLIIAFFTRKNYIIRSEVVILSTPNKVFDYFKILKNQDQYNKWVMVDPKMKRIFNGTDGTVGFIDAWDGNKKAGAGEQEITNIIEGKIIETEIRFIRPFTSVANAKMEVIPINENDSKVIWTMESKMAFPMNIMISMIEKMLLKDMDESLSNLKKILENNT